MIEPGGLELPKKEKPQIIEIKSATSASERHPMRNEDTFFVLSSHNAFGVFDGLGGHLGSEQASRTASRVVENKIRAGKDLSIDQVYANVEAALLNASVAVIDESERIRAYGMATTGTVVQIWEGPLGETTAIIGHIGDSRVYLFREGKLEPLTLDDSGFDKDHAKAWEIQKALARAKSQRDLTTELEKDKFANRNIISKAIGLADFVSPTLRYVGVKPGDVLLTTTDGIHDNLTDPEIEVIIDDALKSGKNSADELVQAAKLKSRRRTFRSKPDDMTAVVGTIKENSGTN